MRIVIKFWVSNPLKNSKIFCVDLENIYNFRKLFNETSLKFWNYSKKLFRKKNSRTGKL